MTAPLLPAPTIDLSAVAHSWAELAVVGAIPSGPQRRWISLGGDDAHDAWAIAWPVGTGLAMHDHDGSRAHVVVVTGELSERYLDADRAVHTRALIPGPGVGLPADHVHEVVNVGPAEAVSIHVYAPPLRGVRDRSDELRWLPGHGGSAPATVAASAATGS